MNLAPGKEIELYESDAPTRPASEAGGQSPSTRTVRRSWKRFAGSGKVSVQYRAARRDVRHRRHSEQTGHREAGTRKSSPMRPRQPGERRKPEQEKEAFTAWGKEAGGLQAGLGYLPGEHRTYHIGETVTLVVRVRNVGKEAVKFQYLRNSSWRSRPP